MTQKSIDGFTGAAGMMPAKGGNMDLTDEEVGSAVAWMASTVDKTKHRIKGAAFRAASSYKLLHTKGELSMSRIISAVAGAMLVISLGSVDAKAAYNAAAGKTVYDASCVACHASGIMGAPKVGLKTAWTSRIPQGLETMVQKSIKGYQGTKGMMPAKGGNAKLTNAEVGNAVAYMVEQSK